jgi:stringent starvation protein B
MIQMIQSKELTSTRPYMIRAWHEWCTDNDLTPYIKVSVDESVQVPRECVDDREIILNIGFNATSNLNIGDDYLEFMARFAGVARTIVIPMEKVLAIFAHENGQGIVFVSTIPSQDSVSEDDQSSMPPLNVRPGTLSLVHSSDASGDPDSPSPPTQSKPKGVSVRPTLKRVK